MTTGNAASLLGHWLNTNRDSRGIAECVIAEDKEEITVSITGASDKETWPIERATVLANVEEEAGQRSVALLATFNFGDRIAETHIRVNKGVLVIVLYVTFHDDSGRSNYLNREFFYRS
ncbi:MAG TPA: hypothetical protein VFO72_06685 [Pyrinomonadaceae bacterium]|nr:hypothetical protein [Pyrinomonadaceae bacterium]